MNCSDTKVLQSSPKDPKGRSKTTTKILPSPKLPPNQGPSPNLPKQNWCRKAKLKAKSLRFKKKTRPFKLSKKINRTKFQAKSKRATLNFHKIQNNLTKIPQKAQPSPRPNLKRSHKPPKSRWKRVKIQRKISIQSPRDQEPRWDYKIDLTLKHQHKMLRKRTKIRQENPKTKKEKRAKRAKWRAQKKERQK